MTNREYLKKYMAASEDEASTMLKKIKEEMTTSTLSTSTLSTLTYEEGIDAFNEKADEIDKRYNKILNKYENATDDLGKVLYANVLKANELRTKYIQALENGEQTAKELQEDFLKETTLHCLQQMKEISNV